MFIRFHSFLMKKKPQEQTKFISADTDPQTFLSFSESRVPAVSVSQSVPFLGWCTALAPQS